MQRKPKSCWSGCAELAAASGALLLLLTVMACADDDDASARRAPDSAVASGRDGGRHDAAMPPPRDSGRAAPDSGPTLDPVARGEYLVEHVAVCGECHTPRRPDGSFDQDRRLSGVECLIDVDRSDDRAGCLSSRNLTDHETGLRNRNDLEIKDMFTRGERPDGKALHPAMPYWALGNMSAADADAIVAYLRTVPGVEHMLPPNQAPFTAPDRPASRFPASAIPMPSADYPERSAALRGRYLAGNIGLCLDCHTPRDARDQPLLARAFQGGQRFSSAALGLPPLFPAEIRSANITPHSNGIGGWSVEALVGAIKRGRDADQGGAALCPPMPGGAMSGYAGLSDADATDIAHYLLAIPPGDNLVPDDCLPPRAPEDVDGGP